MGNESGTWIMHGLPKNDPRCLKSAEDMMDLVDKIGFLPLFKNTVPGFSVEENAAPEYWWTEDPRDPWEWRMDAARSRRVAYGKFFDKKAGFLSLKWLPVFANWRRDGYDFDARYEDGKAQLRQKKIMDRFDTEREILSSRLKNEAGFGKGGEKNFDGVVTELEMLTYLAVSDFRRRINRAGEEYGWNLAVLSTPENIWGYDSVTAAYSEDPKESAALVYKRTEELFPHASAELIRKILK